MALERFYISGIPGLDYVQHPALAYGEPMLMMREGKINIETSDAPAGKQFQYVAAEGKFKLDPLIPIVTGPPPPSPGPVLPGVPEEFYFLMKT